MNRNVIILLSLLVAVVLLVGSFWLGSFVANSRPVAKVIEVILEDSEVQPTYSSGTYSEEFYDLAYSKAGDVQAVESSSGIVAHHMLIADKVAEVFMALGSEDVDTVVMLSPNHFDLGVTSAQTTLGAWGTPYGILEVDADAVQDLVESVEVLEIADSTFDYEHGISALTPFVVRSFPNAKIVPIALHESLSDAQAQEIAQSIVDVLDDAVVIASIDMSHMLPDVTAEFHDAVTLRQIDAGGKCAECDIQLEVDANSVLNVLFAVNSARETQKWNLTHHGSSLQMGATTDWEENTSHILGYFTKGAPTGESFAALHIVGDIMLDRGVRKLIDTAGTVEYPWEKMERYLSGTHLTIGNLEGTVNEQTSTYTYDPPFRFVFSPESVEAMGNYIDVVSLANNHTSDVGSAGQQETKERLTDLGIGWFGSYATPAPRYDEDINGFPLTFIGYHQFQPNESALTEEIEGAKQEGRFVIVMPHWGTEYMNAPSQSQRRLAQLMIDAGADLIIGGHPHVPQGIEVIDGVPVVYSLGNFVFDQYIPETWLAYTIGVIIEEDSIELHIIPVYAKDGQPTPVSDTKAQELLDMLVDVSDVELNNQIKAYKIIIDI
ncbi:MAG: AmmeMemoRadiSam system protein B [Candidatus Uhrbacteria bacterium]|nr:AmmeMemoRadiSam system protein B [Candidatus Uhrbacteria bacterium]